jgi:hypothetical protein
MRYHHLAGRQPLTMAASIATPLEREFSPSRASTDYVGEGSASAVLPCSSTSSNIDASAGYSGGDRNAHASCPPGDDSTSCRKVNPGASAVLQ